MKGLFVGLILVATTGGNAWADCQSESMALEARAASIDGAGLGMCGAARTLASIYQEAANLLRRCPVLDPSGQDAAAYQQGAYDAQASAEASCSNY